jgi:hypothetical protein
MAAANEGRRVSAHQIVEEEVVEAPVETTKLGMSSAFKQEEVVNPVDLQMYAHA